MLKQSLGLRLLIIALLTFLLLIPALIIQLLISDRQEQRDQAVTEVFSKWGKSQVITGPVLSIPYSERTIIDKELIVTNRYLHLLPENLHIKGKTVSETRYRGIYEVVLYQSHLSLEGTFVLPQLKSIDIPNNELRWNQAILSLGITDLKGILEPVVVNWDKKPFSTNPGIKTQDVYSSGISAEIPLSEQQKTHSFSLFLDLKGSETLLFTPVGRITRAELSSDWSSPSFSGAFLPTDRSITENGFRAVWKVLDVNRNYPQVWIANSYKTEDSAFGVNLMLPVDEYQKTMRTAKYAILYIGLTFVAFFMIELLSRKLMHPAHYMLIGFSLLVFYILLLSISEYLLFNYAYLLASFSVIFLITAYTTAILQDHIQTILIAILLLCLYTYLFIIIQLEEFALLMGGIGLFFILAFIMYLTRKIDWFTVFSSKKLKSVEQQRI